MVLTNSPDRIAVLEYSRVGSNAAGRIVLNEGSLIQSEPFGAVPFREMLKKLALAIAHFNPAEVYFLRKDHPDLLPYRLDTKSVQLFKTDPVAAIQSFLFEEVAPSGVSLRDATPIEAAPIRVGYSTLADAFGEYVYLDARGGSAMCPCCGRWSRVSRLDTGDAVFCCKKDCAKVYPDLQFKVVMSRLWCAVEVAALLESPADRFFFPRAWNDAPPWISKASLHNKFTEYKREKEEACKLKDAV